MREVRLCWRQSWSCPRPIRGLGPDPCDLAPWLLAEPAVEGRALEEPGRVRFTSWLCLLLAVESLANYLTPLGLSSIMFKLDTNIPAHREAVHKASGVGHTCSRRSVHARPSPVRAQAGQHLPGVTWESVWEPSLPTPGPVCLPFPISLAPGPPGPRGQQRLSGLMGASPKRSAGRLPRTDEVKGIAARELTASPARKGRQEDRGALISA